MEFAAFSKGLKRSASRVACIQSLYELQFNNDISLDEIILSYKKVKSVLLGEERFPIDLEIYEHIIRGVFEHSDNIDNVLEKKLSEKPQNQDSILLLILKAAVFEYLFSPMFDKKLIISEYCDLTECYFDVRKVKFVNAFLCGLDD